MTLMFDTELALQMSWTALASSTTAGYVFRMGQLVLVLPTNDDRYRGATVRPAASQVFNSLGSLSVIANNVEHTFTNKENKLSFSTVSAVFTVLSDGRLPEDFMEDYITEYQYDSGSYPFKWLPTRVEGSSAVTVIEKHKKDVKYAGSTTVKASCVWLCGGESCTTYRRALPLSLGQLLIVELTYAGCASEEERHFLESWVEGIVVSALPRF
ncbi:hypothetical protein AGDE_14417 [Angomonas deanei]|uniref:Uncharacterized protein n=1 Tax=Angomonas deanei TaxID=59799 RepID=A0A7G2CSF5_9TRYP|nr:hypothetical protein AGDE_14417 [Angomonas deanei]CAD2222127.1 hypothetical protein, conserved [Angomonas deanei]|eukprot:EPY20904.1 hypothetical protein AGDE_14417 [Angomonas deanei]